MKTQRDSKTRIVALENLKAICERASGFCHTFEVSKVSRSRVHVEYSNPSEYGTPKPMTAVFPAIPNPWDKTGENPYVLIGELMRVLGDNWDGEGWQAFEPVVNGPELFRNGPGDDSAETWQTREEIETAKAGA